MKEKTLQKMQKTPVRKTSVPKRKDFEKTTSVPKRKKVQDEENLTFEKDFCT